MSDLSRFLPLSQRQNGDETGVTGDWSALIADCLELLVPLLTPLTADQWSAPVGAEGSDVARTIDDLADRCDEGGRWWAPSAIARLLVTETVDPHTADTDTSIAAGAAESASASASERRIDRLRHSALRLRSADGRRRLSRPGVGLLGRVVVAGYDVSRVVGVPVAFPALATGAVALARATAAPTPIRAVIRGRTLVATDAGWRFGTGPELAGTALEHILFLFDRSDRVPGA